MNTQNWRPMTTAPKDGRSVMIFDFRAQAVFRCQWRTKQYPAMRRSQYEAWVITNKGEPGGEEMTADCPLAWMPAPDGMPLPEPLRYFLCSVGCGDRRYPELYQERLAAITETLEEERSGTIWLRIYTWMGSRPADNARYCGTISPEKGVVIKVLHRLSQVDVEGINRYLRTNFSDEHYRLFAACLEKPDDRFNTPEQVLDEALEIWRRDYPGLDMVVVEEHLDSTIVLNWESAVNVG